MSKNLIKESLSLVGNLSEQLTPLHFIGNV